MWHQSFEPVIDKNSSVLILGSFPSVKSREVGFYYGHKQNRFWKTLEKIFDDLVPPDVDGKKKYLLSHGVALWDVIERSTIDGSSDADINLENSVPVDFNRVLKGYPNINLIILNGKTAYEIFKRFNPDCKIPFICLKSTSPRNPHFDLEEWKNAILGAIK